VNDSKVTGTGNHTSQAWLRALELTAPIARNRSRVMPTVIEELAVRWGDAPALLSDRECLTYSGLAGRQNQYARWALAQGIEKGEVVSLLMPNRPEYLAIWLGISSIGAVTALMNTNLSGPSLSHSINVVRPRHIIAAAECIEQIQAVIPDLTSSPTLWSHGIDCGSFRRIDLDVEQRRSETLSREERAEVTIEDQALYIYTSGTTGMPKGAKVSHARVLQWSYWFAGMLQAQPNDRIYNCLPMYHSIGGVLVPGAVLAAGGSMVIREKFSCSQFWADILRWDCTLFQYIGELCRYLIQGTTKADAAGHRIRIACGNGMASDVWDEFKDKFDIPRVLEFYASTEGGVSLFNVEEKRGAIGRIPPYLAHRFAPELVRFDCESGEPVRDGEGRCIRCVTNEPGEALGRFVDDPAAVGIRFDGYSDPRASQEKILRDVFKPGDAWIRTGDLMRKDERGFYYFVDRIGDTFRWKGENVATSEVSEAICAYPGVKHANVYGVSIPATEGAAGMAALVTEDEIDLNHFRSYLAHRLPVYARPLFLRMLGEMEITGTFKYSKSDLKREGYDPTAIADRIYFDSHEQRAFVPLDQALYQRIRGGEIRL
jgi:fatty-acyl-CoA synthase